MARTSHVGMFLGPLLVFLVVGGVAFFLLSQKVQQRLPPQSSPSSTLSVTSSALLLVFPNPRTPFDEVLALDPSSHTQNILQPPTGWRLSAYERKGIRIALQEGTEISRLLGPRDWNVTLRNIQGVPYQDPVFLGFFDDDHVGILAHIDERELLSVSRFGEVRRVMTLDDEMSIRSLERGFAWVVTLAAGEGIESSPKGPSTLRRVSQRGKVEMVAQSPGAITRVVPSVSNAQVFAYGTEEGTFTVLGTSTSTWQGMGVPLLWINSDTLLFVHGTTLFQRQMASSTAEKLGALPAIPGAVFISSSHEQLW